VFIYLAKAPKNVPAPPTEPVVFDQKSCIFLPHALVVQTNQPVTILNADGALHNTHTYPKRNSVFNQGVQPNDREGVKLVYTRAEAQPFQVGCDVHPWMVAWHLPLDHPYAAVSGPDGTFEIKDVPAGKHEFKIWHEKGGELQKAYSVTIKPNEPTEVEIPVPAAKLALFQGPASKVIQLSSTR
jgi:plastocyanin